MGIRWFTLREFIDVFGERSYANPTLSQYVVELGNGWRLWATLSPIIIALSIVALAFGLPKVFSIIICLMAIFAPVVMTSGYLLGGIMMKFPCRVVLWIAYHHIQK